MAAKNNKNEKAKKVFYTAEELFGHGEKTQKILSYTSFTIKMKSRSIFFRPPRIPDQYVYRPNRWMNTGVNKFDSYSLGRILASNFSSSSCDFCNFFSWADDSSLISI
jgi:hypothetical protein